MTYEQHEAVHPKERRKKIILKDMTAQNLEV
jgi:hypothetical protein